SCCPTGPDNRARTQSEPAPATSRAILGGTGIGAVSVSPPSLSFGNQAIRLRSAPQLLTVTNNQTARASRIPYRPIQRSDRLLVDFGRARKVLQSTFVIALQSHSPARPQ